MKRINLLPPEIIAGRKARREATLLATVYGSVVAVLVIVWLAVHFSLSHQQERLSNAQARSQALQVRINSLQKFAVLEQSIQNRVATLSGAMANDVGWSRLLRDVSNIIPSNSWLTAFRGSVSDAPAGTTAASPAISPAPAGGSPGQAAPAAPGAPATGPAPQPGASAVPGAAPGTLPPKMGTLSFTAVTFDFPGVARWITTLEQLGTLQNIFVPTAAKEQREGREVVNFTSTADLSPAARSGRYQAKRP